MDEKIRKIIKNPGLLFLTLGHRGLFNWLKDRDYLKIAFKIKMGRKLNLTAPEAYSDKLQWLKLNYRKPILTRLVDKYEVKNYVADRIGDDYIIPTLGVYDHFEEIDFDKLPNQFVLKCTHDSGGIVICKDKSKFNKGKAKKVLQECLKHNYYYGQREWPYKDVPHRIIAEKYMEDRQYGELRDYKFFCFDGVVKALFIATDRYKKGVDTKFDFFDENFTHLDFRQGHPNADILPQKPECFEEMKELAVKLSKGFPHVRIDFYEVEGRVYFGEMTFFHFSGLEPFDSEDWDYKFGEWLTLPEEKF